MRIRLSLAVFVIMIGVGSGLSGARKTIRNGALTQNDLTLSGGEYYDVYPLTLQYGEQLAITLTSTDFDTYLIYIDPSGKNFRNHTSGPQRPLSRSRLTVVCAEPGKAEIWATSNKGGQTGHYRLTIERSISAGARYDDSRLRRDIAELDQKLSRHINAYVGEVPGIGVGVVRNGKAIIARGYGYADLEKRRPFTPDTYFRVGSLSKIVSAVCALILVERGKLRLDDKVAAYIPDIARIEDLSGTAMQMTVQHLLSNQAGLPLDVRKIYSTDDLSLAELTRHIIKTSRLEHPVGKKFHYSNLGYVLLGRIIEIVSRKSFVEFARSELLAPLDMSRSSYRIDVQPESEWAFGYDKKRKSARNRANINYQSGANLITTITDYQRFLIFLQNRGEYKGRRRLAQKTLDLLFRDPFGTRYGMGCYISKYDYAHGGSLWLGHKCGFTLSFRKNIGVVIFGNGDNLTARRRSDIYKLVFAHFKP